MASVRVKDLPKDEGGGVSRPLYTTAEYLNLLANAVTIEGLDYKKARYVIKLLIDEGAVGYDSITDRFYKISEIGKDEEGDPIKGMFYAQNNKKFTRNLSYEPKEDGAYYIRALPYGEITLREIVERSCEFIGLCDTALIQNLKASMTPYIVAVKDKDTLLSVRHALQQKEDGQAVLIVSEGLSDALQATKIGVEFLGDKFVQLKDGEVNRLLKKIGIVTDVVKGERVQTSEVNANVCQASDYIYMMIDTFNKQCEQYGLTRYKMVSNGTFEELYVDDETAEQPQEENL